jgi:hypothetical protein
VTLFEKPISTLDWLWGAAVLVAVFLADYFFFGGDLVTHYFGLSRDS